MHMKSTSNSSNINKNQKLFLTDLVKLFLACSSWGILQHHLNRILDCYLTGIFELCQDIILNINTYIN